MEGEHFFEEYTEVQKLASVLRGQYCTLTCFESVNTTIVCAVLYVVWYLRTYVRMYVPSLFNTSHGYCVCIDTYVHTYVQYVCMYI